MQKANAAVAPSNESDSKLGAALERANSIANAPLTRDIGKSIALGAGAALGYIGVSLVYNAIAN